MLVWNEVYIMHNYFIEIPLYRIPYDNYNNELSQKTQDIYDSNYPINIENYHISELEKDNCAPWQYNQVIGWVRLFFLGNQFKGELWLHNAKRYTRKMKNKRFEYSNNVIGAEIPTDLANKEIAKLIMTELKSFGDNFHNKKRYLDISQFQRIACYIDWKSLINQAINGN